MTAPGLGPPLHGAAAWLMRHLPQTVAVEPERVLINLGCALIGLSGLLNTPEDMQNLWPGAHYEWGAVMLAGGFFTLLGMFRRQRSTERLGLLLVTVGALFFAGVLLFSAGLDGFITALIFIFIAFAKVIRLNVSSAVRSHNIQIGEQMKEALPPPPRTEDR